MFDPRSKGLFLINGTTGKKERHSVVGILRENTVNNYLRDLLLVVEVKIPFKRLQNISHHEKLTITEKICVKKLVINTKGNLLPLKDITQNRKKTKPGKTNVVK